MRISAEIYGSDDGTNPFLAAVRATRMPIIITNPRLPDNPTVFVNDAFCRMTGYAREEILGTNCRFLQGAGTDPEAVDKIRQAVKAVESLNIDIRNHRKDGSTFWNRLLLAPVRDATGQLAYFFASQVDVTLEREHLTDLETHNAALLAELTDRLRQQEEDAATLRQAVAAEKRVKDELLVKAAEFEALAENVRHLAWMADADGHIHWYNKRWYSYTGTTLESMQGWGWREVHHPDHVARVLRDVGERWKKGESWQDIFLLRSAEGEYRPFLTHAEPIFDRTGKLVRWFGTNTDITPQQDAEQQLRLLNQTLAERVEEEVAKRFKTEELLRQAQKMEAVGQLTGGLAHDFNNLLTGITGSLELLQTRVQQGRTAELGRYVVAAVDAATRAAALTHRLLAFSRRQTLEPKATNIDQLAIGMADLIRRTIGPSIELDFVSADETWLTLIDPSQLENSLLNLCINARDAMPDGGRLTVETHNLRLDAQAGAMRDLPPGEYLSLAVTDNGAGMPPEVAARAFDPFYTTKPLGQGTGLGLSMIYGFTKQSGGQARIHTAEGHGTTVCLYLPRYVSEAEASQSALPVMEVLEPVFGRTVLLVDDEATIRMLAADVLEDLGYRVLQSDCGSSGLDALNTAGHLDLLLTDVGLPGGINGRQLADAARVARPGLKVLFITGYAESAVLSHGHLDPGMHLLTKPFTMNALASRVSELLTS
ncbi:MAG: PAS domain-containing protein [Janthinobacterium lividum]